MHDAAQEGITRHDTELTLDQLDRNLRDVRTVLTGHRDGLAALIETCEAGLADIDELRRNTLSHTHN